MSSPHSPSVVLSGLSFAWPDGTDVIHGIDAVFGSARTGLVGANGTGKTTLLRLIAGELTPSAGTVSVVGDVAHLPQQIALRAGETVAGLLGVRERLDALRAIESGDADPAHFDALADDWDVEARSRAVLDGIGLSSIGLDRPVGTLSGGETVLAALAGLRLSGADVVLLDEPTNSLDRSARHRLYDAVATWRGALVVVSHDVALLDLMDDTAELRTGSLTVFGGPFGAYQEHVAQEQAAAEQALRTAQQRLRTERRQRVEAETMLARRLRYGRTDFESKRKPKIIMNQRKREAQVSAGRLRGELDEKVDLARQAVDAQAARVRRDARIAVELPDPDVPVGRRLAELADADTSVVIQGPERVALTGRNGIGKTLLLDALVHARSDDRGTDTGSTSLPTPADARPGEGAVSALATARSARPAVRARRHTERIGYLPQRLDQLDDDASVLDTVRAAAPSVPPGEVRASLARFLFRADAIHRTVGDLSGGERFRVALATLLLADPPNQLLVLDEPTNSLDLATVDELVDALDGYRGGLLVVSHDDAFLARLRIDTWLTLDEHGLHRGHRDEPATMGA